MKSSYSRWLSVIGIVLIVASVILLIGFGLKGQTKVSGNYPDDIKSISLKCVSSTTIYPFFAYDNAVSRNTSVNILFADNKLSTISLTSELNYSDDTSINASYSHNHAAMNKAFAEEGLGADSFSARYTKSKDKMIMSLYAKSSDLNYNSMKFFLADNVNPSSNMEEFENNYNKQGFTCEQS